MTDQLSDGLLAQLRGLIQTAKGVPMSASCLVNRDAALSLIDQAAAAVQQDLAAAAASNEQAEATLQRAQQEAEEILHNAREQAGRLASDHEVMQLAKRQAETLTRDTLADTAGLRREADAYVDGRIAVFEANLQKTISQIRTMRERLAARSGLDDTSTQLLPRVKD